MALGNSDENFDTFYLYDNYIKSPMNFRYFY